MKLRIENISKRFSEKPVLSGISFTASSGSAMGLLGRNGAGKTTTIRIAMGVFPPDGGSVTLDGKQISHTGARFGYLPEERGLYPKQKIVDQMIYIGKLRGMSGGDAAKNAASWLDRFDMAQHKNDMLRTLSKGNQQKIQLAVALINDPDIVILDEPFSGLDPVNAQLLKDVVTEQVANGKIVMFSSHQMGYVEEFCDSIAILEKGKIVLDGNLRDIKRGYERNQIKLLLSGGDTEERMDSMRQAGKLGSFVQNIKAADDSAVITLSGAEYKDKLLSAILDSGASIEVFQVMEPTLEQIFVEKAGDVNE